ncbi:IST1 homolog isoform X4 [Excalfactoria chinensis]|uniref:IST1 homolog isoform X4 n=2 Tax=Excalfactoria chinensis TaxID=46218 RepID=UPI003B3B68F4
METHGVPGRDQRRFPRARSSPTFSHGRPHESGCQRAGRGSGTRRRRNLRAGSRQRRARSERCNRKRGARESLRRKLLIMLGSGFKAERLRVNLRLVINRLKLLEKKKTELAQKARKEIADYLAAGKDERARIRVEHIIREDYLVEAMEILELYCDLLLARFGLIQSMKELDSGLAEAVSTLIWAAPRLQSEVAELKIVADQLCAKYSKEYGKLCRTNQIGTVNDRLMHKLSVEAPPKILVERYLIEIAKNYNVPYEPDSVVMAEAPAGVEADLIDVGFTDDVKKGGHGGGGGGGFTAPLVGLDGLVPVPVPMPMPMPSTNPPFSYPPPKGPENFSGLPVGTYQPFTNIHPPPIPANPPTYESGLDPNQKLLQNQELDLLIPSIILYCLNCLLCQIRCQQHLLVPILLPLKTLTLMIFLGDLRS